MFVPAPNLALLPFTIAVPELSPWLAVLGLLTCALALRYHRRLAPFLLGAALILFFPLAEVAGVERRMESQLSTSAPLHLLEFFRNTPRSSIEPETLPLNIRYYRPAGDGPHPALIDIYGGAWQRGAPQDSRQFDSYLAHKGYAVFAIDYRHAPAFRFPAQIEDVRAAISFVHANAAQYRADPDRLILCGRSAGGQLALLAAYEPGPGAGSRGDQLLRPDGSGRGLYGLAVARPHRRAPGAERRTWAGRRLRRRWRIAPRRPSPTHSAHCRPRC